MIYHDKPYLQLLDMIVDDGVEKTDRTGTGTLSIFGEQLSFSLMDGYFPLLNTKHVSIDNVSNELDWFLSGSTNIKWLIDRKCNIWNSDCYRVYQTKHGSKLTFKEFIDKIKTDEEFSLEHGNMGKIYGYQWRKWFGEYDQIKNVYESLKTEPFSRRHVITAWNPAELKNMGLPPCHILIQFNCSPISETRQKVLQTKSNIQLDLKFVMRSTDTFLGLPYNIASYSILLIKFAYALGYFPGKVVFSGGDIHLYKNHIEAAKIQLEREPFVSPRFYIDESFIPQDILSKWDETDVLKKLNSIPIKIENYVHHPTIKAPLSTGAVIDSNDD